MQSIKIKLLLLLLLVSFVPLSALGLINYFKTTEIFTETVQEYLHQIVKAKEGTLEEYLKSTESIGEAIASIDLVQTYIQHTNRNVSQKNQDAFKRIANGVDNILYSFQESYWGKYHHIFIINQSRRIVISPNHGKNEKGSPSSHLGEDTSENKWATQALKSGETSVSDYSSWRESDHSHQMLFYPAKDSKGHVNALIGFELQIPYEQKLLMEGFRLGETGRIFLTTEDGVPIVYKGIHNEEPLRTPGLSEVLVSGISTGRRMNAKGREVIDLYAKHKHYPWIVVAEIETDEAFHGLYGLQTLLIAGLVSTLGLIVIMSLVFTNAVVTPIRTLTSQMEKISLGEFDINISDTKRKDEVGKLIQAFQRLVISLKIAMKQLQDSKSQKRE